MKQVQDWINISTSSVTGYTPYELHFGKDLQDKIRALLEFPDRESESSETKIELARERIRLAGEKRTKSQGSVSRVNITERQLVLLKIPYKSDKDEQKISKFYHIFYGPYQVNRIFGENACELIYTSPPFAVKGVYNRTDLRIYHSPEEQRNV